MSAPLVHDRKVPTKRKGFLPLSAVAVALLLLAAAARAATSPPADPLLLQKTYTREETLRYEILWLGLKAGELVINLAPAETARQRFAIRVTARTAGLLATFYPVEDHFETVVEGMSRLPVRYAVEQHEGKRQKKKLTLYDQQRGAIAYQRNAEPTRNYKVKGETHNEFSAFMIMRALPLAVGGEVMIPTFADEKRHEVKVRVEGEEIIDTIYGKTATLRVRPHLTFKGLYKKAGDPVIWLSNNQYRVPLLIKAKIVIGSLSARLVGYSRQPVISNEDGD